MAMLEWTIGQVSERTGLPVSTLHFYERKGLVRSTRTRGNQRRYSRAAVRRLSIIRFAQELGIPLKEIAEALSTLPDDRVATREDWEHISAKWSKALDERLLKLQRLRDNLGACIGCGCLSLDKCILYNRDDVRAAEGPGARTLVSGPAVASND
ncbi:MAG: redox-sensitive transcriptional activator SoxR [Oricola sp.]